MQLIEIERATEEIASDFSTRLITSPSHKKLRIPEFFRAAYLSNLTSHMASGNLTHKKLWYHPLFEGIHS